jgi:hypothetical protein
MRSEEEKQIQAGAEEERAGRAHTKTRDKAQVEELRQIYSIKLKAPLQLEG